MKFYVYTHSTTEHQVFYVGKGTKNRAFSNRGRNTKWKWVSEKHGLKIEIVKFFEIESEAFAFEKELIKFHNTLTSDWSSLTVACNFTEGGSGGSITGGLKFPNRKRPPPVTQETRDKISKANKGRKLSEEFKEKCRQRQFKRKGEKRSKAYLEKVIATRRSPEGREVARKAAIDGWKTRRENEKKRKQNVV